MNYIVILIAINVIIFVLPYIVDFGRGMVTSNDAFLMMFWQQSDKIKDGEYYRLITSQFLHGSAVHIFFNMYTLWQVKSYAMNMHLMLNIGRNNSQFAPLIFLFVYLVSGIGGGLASVYTSNVPSVGASGAILGIFGFMTAYAIRENDQNLLQGMLINILLLGVMGFLIPNINNTAHAGGFITGLVLYFVLLFAFELVLKK